MHFLLGAFLFNTHQYVDEFHSDLRGFRLVKFWISESLLYLFHSLHLSNIIPQRTCARGYGDKHFSISRFSP